jgi:hypothetical protein
MLRGQVLLQTIQVILLQEPAEPNALHSCPAACVALSTATSEAVHSSRPRYLLLLLDLPLVPSCVGVAKGAGRGVPKAPGVGIAPGPCAVPWWIWWGVGVPGSWAPGW